MNIRLILSGLVALISCGLSVSPAWAAGYTLTLQQVGPDVVASGSGELDLTGLMVSAFSPFTAEMQPNGGIIVTGPTLALNLREYGGISGPTSFGSGNNTVASSGSGVPVAINGVSGFLAVPPGYVSGGALSDTATYSGQTFASLGVTAGTYEWTWGGGTGDRNFTLEIGQAAVPEPATWTAGALLAFGLFSHFVRRRRSPSA
jgi:hypothetical protein